MSNPRIDFIVVGTDKETGRLLATSMPFHSERLAWEYVDHLTVSSSSTEWNVYKRERVERRWKLDRD